MKQKQLVIVPDPNLKKNIYKKIKIKNPLNVQKHPSV